MIKLDLQVRVANLDDIELILACLVQKAEFDGNLNTLTVTTDKLKQTLFRHPPLATVLFAEVEGVVVGFALFFYIYSSFLAQPGIWLDDIFVKPQMRGKGVGTALLKHIAKTAKAQNCGRIEWTVAANNNRGIAFYHKHGAKILADVRLCRVESAAIAQLASN